MHLFDDIKALERFPFARAARAYANPQARGRFINRTRDNSVCPYGILREIGGGAAR